VHREAAGLPATVGGEAGDKLHFHWLKGLFEDACAALSSGLDALCAFIGIKVGGHRCMIFTSSEQFAIVSLIPHYNCTGKTGTYRYMAPRVFRHEPWKGKLIGVKVGRPGALQRCSCDLQA
jgi:hypothetical protein